MKRLLTVLVLTLLTGLSYAQLPGIQWQRWYTTIPMQYYGGTRHYQPPLALPDGFLIAGIAYVPGYQYGRVGLTRVDLEGNVLWRKDYGGTNGASGGSVHLLRANDGNIVFATNSQATNGDVAGNTDVNNGNIWVVKIDQNGAILRSRIIDARDYFEQVFSFLPTSNGTGYVMSASFSGNIALFPNQISRCHPAASGFNYKFLRFDNDLNLVQEKCLTPNYQHLQQLNLVAAGPNRFFLFENPSLTNCTVNRPGAISLIDDTARVIWTKPLSDYALPSAYFALSEPTFLKQHANAFIVPLMNIGSCMIGGPGPSPTFLLKIDTLGNLAWKKQLSVDRGQPTALTDAGDGTSFLLSRGLQIDMRPIFDSSVLLRVAYADGAELAQRTVGTYINYWWPEGLPYQETRPIRGGNGDLYFWGPRWRDYQLAPYEAHNVIGRLGPVNRISGRVYVDGNSNGVFDTGDSLLYNRKVLARKANGDLAIAFTDRYGRYELTTDTGSYSPELQLGDFTPHFVVDAGNVSFTHASYGFTDNLDLTARPAQTGYDVAANLVSPSAVIPGFESDYVLTYSKVSWDGPSTGSLLFRKDPRTTLVSASRPPTVQGDSLQWTFTGLRPMSTDSIRVRLRTAAPPAVNIGDTLRFRLQVTGAAAQWTAANDTATLRQLVVGAFDPNDKQERNAGRYSNGQFQNYEPLQYTIRFQNTGNYPASTVVVRDTLSDLLDASSIQLLGASHRYTFKMTGNKALEWTFSNINLPDSTSNRAGSQGYLVFQVRMKPPFDLTTVIPNTAAIYFDYNPPIYTNTHLTRMYATVFTTGLYPVEIQALQLTAVPNPARGTLRLKVQADKAYRTATLRLFATDGTELRTTRAPLQAGPNWIPVELGNLPGATYFAAVTVDGKTYTTMLVKQ
ncbi:MAG: isopeptide-forming domain-containing fimbrial protein [Chitinophagaceae bacterium]|nr:MAG: isopeptide-forming domain-containing fimbrial protein [Chitinophagaceae bacterium]